MVTDIPRLCTNQRFARSSVDEGHVERLDEVGEEWNGRPIIGGQFAQACNRRSSANHRLDKLRADDFLVGLSLLDHRGPDEYVL